MQGLESHLHVHIALLVSLPLFAFAFSLSRFLYIISRGLEDHYAEMIGKTNSYYIRKRHEELVLREYYRLRYAPQADVKLAHVAEESAEEERERAIEMAKLDECMAKEEGQEGATTSPVGAPLFTSGEAFLHTLMVRLRDYT